MQTAGIPLEKVVGFRAPYLIFDPQQRDILESNGFRYDSSITEQYPSTTSPSAAERVWPYTMDYGIPQDCTVRWGMGQCRGGGRARMWMLIEGHPQAQRRTEADGAPTTPPPPPCSTGTCGVDETHPGLWEFPMWNVQDSTTASIASMDPQGDAFALYQLQFQQRYNGNRAPLGIYLHAAWFIADPT